MTWKYNALKLKMQSPLCFHNWSVIYPKNKDYLYWVKITLSVWLPPWLHTNNFLTGLYGLIPEDLEFINWWSACKLFFIANWKEILFYVGVSRIQIDRDRYGAQEILTKIKRKIIYEILIWGESSMTNLVKIHCLQSIQPFQMLCVLNTIISTVPDRQLVQSSR